jgi:uncharacterized protein YdaT
MSYEEPPIAYSPAWKWVAAIRAEAIREFIERQAVVYRDHSAEAIQEDMRLAVEEFGVIPGEGWPS